MENPSRFSPKNPHFFQPLLPGFKSTSYKIPVKFFSKHIEGKHEGKTVNLRTDSSERTWNVKMEGHRITNGWKKFVEPHDLRIGDFVVFRHEGDMLFHVTILGTSCCEIQYAPSRSHDEEEESDEIGESSRKEKEIEENVKTESDQFSSDLTCFSQSVTASNLTIDSVTVPVAFAKRNGLSKGRHEIVLMNEKGKSWESQVKCRMSGQVFIVGGWTSFCTENKLEVGDSCTFKLFHNAKTPVFWLFSRTKAETNRFVKLTPTPSSLELGKQIEQSPFEAEARPHKRARVQRWSRKSRSKHDVRQKIAEEGGPSNKSTGDPGKLQHPQFYSISDHVAKEKQSVEDILISITQLGAKLETKKQNLEALLQEI